MQTNGEHARAVLPRLQQVAHAAQAAKTSQTSQRAEGKEARAVHETHRGHTKITKNNKAHTSYTGQQLFIKQTNSLTHPPFGGLGGGQSVNTQATTEGEDNAEKTTRC